MTGNLSLFKMSPKTNRRFSGDVSRFLRLHSLLAQATHAKKRSSSEQAIVSHAAQYCLNIIRDFKELFSFDNIICVGSEIFFTHLKVFTGFKLKSYRSKCPNIFPGKFFFNSFSAAFFQITEAQHLRCMHQFESIQFTDTAFVCAEIPVELNPFITIQLYIFLEVEVNKVYVPFKMKRVNNTGV